MTRTWWQRQQRIKERRAKAAAQLREPVRIAPKVVSPERRARRRAYAVAAAWLLGVALVSWALVDVVGPAGWKVGAGFLLLSCGGLVPLWRVILGGVVLYPPSDWFTEEG